MFIAVRLLEALYNYLKEQYYKFDAPVRAEMEGHFDDLVPGYDLNGETRKTFERAMEHVFGGLLLNWVGTTPEAIKKYQIGLSSDYYMFRRSVRSSEHIVRSEVKIEQIAIKDLSVTHRHYDRNEDMRVSSGFMVPAEFNHFAVMNVENGASIEFIALKKPITEIFKRLIGFIITINSNGVLVCARAVLIKKENLSFEPPYPLLRKKIFIGPRAGSHTAIS